MASARESWAENNGTEIKTNTYSYYYFGQPKGWDFDQYPINELYISGEFLQIFKHKK